MSSQNATTHDPVRLISPLPRRNPVRLGYCIDSFAIGGTELNAVRTLEALRRDRVQATVFHFHEDGPLRRRYESLGVPMVHVPISRLYSPRTLLEGLRFVSSLRREKIEIVHTHDLYTNVFAGPWARAGAGCHVIASRRWSYDAPRSGLVPLNRWSYRFATRVLANSPAIARLLVEEENIPPEKVIELPNFLEERAFERVGGEDRVRQRRDWGIPDGAFVVGIVARLAPVKNHALLLRAAQRLNPSVHIVLVGDGPARSSLERLAAELGIRARTHFLGELVSLTNLHQFFEVSVLCSLSEGFPNSLIEALAARRPVVSTPVGGVADVIVENDSGLLVPIDDPDVLADRIERLRLDALLCARLGETGRNLVREKYHQGAVIGRLEALYGELSPESASHELPTK